MERKRTLIQVREFSESWNCDPQEHTHRRGPSHSKAKLARRGQRKPWGKIACEQGGKARIMGTTEIRREMTGFSNRKVTSDLDKNSLIGIVE